MAPKAPEQLALDFIGQLVKGTEFEGKVFLAGGAVRDELMGQPIKDIDIVVSMPDGGIKFAEWITRKIGRYREGSNPTTFPKFGTAKFNLRGVKSGDVDISGIDIEVVMTRGEKYEKGSRKPEVVYADLKDDAFRRDLTVNSLFKDVVTGEIHDLTGHGISDIKKGIVRTPTDPDQTFSDDPLRMLRAIRFAVKYDWKMPLSMIKALKRNADQLKNISQERIRDELSKILVSKHPDKGLRILSATGLLKHIIPELEASKGVKQNEHHKHDVFEHILEVIKNSAPELNVRLAALFHDIGKPATKTTGSDGRVHFYKHEEVGAEMAQTIMNRLKFTGEETESVKRIVFNHMNLKAAGKDGEKASDKQIRKFMTTMGKDLGPALKLMHADNISHKAESAAPNQIVNLAKRMQQLQSDMGAANEKPKLPVNGNDIMQTLGIKPGPEVKRALDAVMDAWHKNPKITRDQALQVVKAIQQPKSQNNFSDVLKQTIVNPVTGNTILVKTALKYDKTHPARQAAAKLLQGN